MLFHVENFKHKQSLIKLRYMCHLDDTPELFEKQKKDHFLGSDTGAF
jgi:hypothetical protein